MQMDQVKQDLSRKDTQLLGLQTKLETLTNQFSDSKQHIEVLKESLTAKEQRAAILQTEVVDQASDWSSPITPADSLSMAHTSFCRWML